MLKIDDHFLLDYLFWSFYFIHVNVTFLLKFNLAISHFSTQAQFDYRYWFSVSILYCFKLLPLSLKDAFCSPHAGDSS